MTSKLPQTSVLASTSSSVSIPVDDQELERLYAAVLDHLLFPPNVKQDLMKTQSKEKKWQMVQMHQTSMGSGGKKLASWGEREQSILVSLNKAKLPDIKGIAHIKTVLTTANREVLVQFLDCEGISVMIKCVNERLSRPTISELDAAILYELVSCLKVTMNNQTGMDAVLEHSGAVDAIARCLLFEWKALALLVFEILSCCCYYSESATNFVINGLRQLSVSRGEASFTGLVNALLYEDIQIRSEVMSLINHMIMGLLDAKARAILRDEFRRLLLVEKMKESIASAQNDMKTFRDLGKTKTGAQPIRHIVSFHGSRSLEEKFQGFQGLNDAEGNRRVSTAMKGKLPQAATLSPLHGTMAGFLHAAKNAERSSTAGDFLGVKKTKHRWYFLDGENFHWALDKGSESAGVIPVASVVDIRSFSSDVNLRKVAKNCFEVETTERVFALGSDTEKEKENWLTAFRIARDKAVVSASEFRTKITPLTFSDAVKHFTHLKKEVEVFESISVEDRKYTVTKEGLDAGNLTDLTRFVQLQAVASGCEGKLHALLQQLVLLPPGTEGVWDRIINSARGVKEEIETSLKDGTIAGAGAYQQMSKLAMLVITAENESKVLKTASSPSKPVAEQVLPSLSPQASRRTVSEASAAVLPPQGPKTVIDTAAPLTTQASMRTLVEPAATLTTQGSKRMLLDPAPAGAQFKESSIRTRNQSTDVSGGVLPRAVTDSSGPGTSSSSLTNAGPISAISTAVLTGSSGAASSSSTSVSGPVSAATVAIGPPARNGTMTNASSSQLPTPPSASSSSSTGTGLSPSAALGAALTARKPPPVQEEQQQPSINADSDRYAKYHKMRKMLPEGAVRQKMTTEGFSPQEVDDFFNSPMAPSSASNAPAAEAKLDERIDKFFKMRKMLPEGAVRQKMMTEGFTKEEIDRFFLTDAPSTSESTPPAEPVASTNDDPRYEKFVKMRKMLPEPAVRQKMATEGFTQQEIDAFFGGVSSVAAPKEKAAPPVEAALPPGLKEKPILKPKKKLKALFWTKLKPVEAVETLWGKTEDVAFSPGEADELEEWFGAVAPKPVVEEKSPEKGKPKAMSLMDGKRTQNVLIALGKIKLAPAAVVDYVTSLDKSKLTLELAEVLVSLAPTPEEVTTVKGYSGDTELLDRASAFYWHVCRVPRFKNRLDCHIISFKWFGEMDEILLKYNVLQSACRDIAGSEGSIVKILSLILAVGNYMNGGSTRGQAYGVKIDVLNKLSTIKGNLADQGTVLHFIARHIYNKYGDELVSFADGWTAAWATGEVSMKDLDRDLKRLETQVETMKNELKVGVPMVRKDSGEEAATTLQSMIQGFLDEAEPRLQDMRMIKDDTKVRISELASKFGETLVESSAEEGDPWKGFLDCIVSFARSFKLAVEDNANVRKKLMVAERRKEEASRRTSTKVDRPLEGGETTPLPLSPEADKKVSENIFASFLSAKEASSETLINDFKLKLERSKKLVDYDA